MQMPFQRDGTCNPQDISLHRQLKEIADLLRPELMRLHKCFACKEGNIQLYLSLIEQIRLVQKEMANRDALFTLQNILDRMSKAIELSKINASNQEILWHLQEVMALLFKLQSIPS